jgi:thioredoxin 1
MNTPDSPQLRATDELHFDRDVRSAPQVLVTFTGTWCPPCHALKPTLEALARERADVLVLTVDVDAQQGVAQRYGVRSIPTLLLFREGRPVSQRVGNQSRAALEQLLRC